jgi:hypothetical protein
VAPPQGGCWGQLAPGWNLAIGRRSQFLLVLGHEAHPKTTLSGVVFQKIEQWRPPAGRRITPCRCNPESFRKSRRPVRPGYAVTHYESKRSGLATWIGKSCFGLNLLALPKSIQVHLRILRFTDRRLDTWLFAHCPSPVMLGLLRWDRELEWSNGLHIVPL